MTRSFLDIPKWIRISHPSYLRIWWVFGIIKRVSNGMITNLAIKNNTLVYCGQKCSSCVCRVTLSIDVSHQLSRNSCFVVLPFSDTIFWTFKKCLTSVFWLYPIEFFVLLPLHFVNQLKSYLYVRCLTWSKSRFLFGQILAMIYRKR